MTISAKVICDSVFAKLGHRITTMELKYPRFIHAEFMTHRVFSRNASSSRAIPIQRQIDMIKEDTAMPVHWGKNQPGMQANEELEGADRGLAQTIWLQARDSAIIQAEALLALGAHKQIVNRILEPFSHITVLVTADQWANFYALRNHPDAQPEIRELAQKMAAARDSSDPVELTYSDWHLPYITDEDRTAAYHKCKEGRITRNEPTKEEINELLCAISAARCARVSYLTHDKLVPTMEQDLELYRRLAYAEPPHMSPCEHQAQHNSSSGPTEGNFRYWNQFRHLIRYNTVYD